MELLREEFITTYRRELYAYVIMLKQFSGRYSEPTLKTAASDIESLYKGLEQINKITELNKDEVKQALKSLRLGVLNLQIIICNKHYTDIVPICEAISNLVYRVESDIVEGEERLK